MPEIATLASIVHLHLLLNHAPTVGTVIAVGLLALGFVRRSDHLTRVGLELVFGIALVTLPLFLSGMAARAALMDTEGVSVAAITAHGDAALWAFVLMEAVGAVAWFALWQRRRTSQPARSMVWVVFALTCLTLSILIRTANLGGSIRHPEILSNPDAAAVAPAGGWLTLGSIAGFVLDHAWVWPMSEALHFLGMSLMFGVLLVVNLRLLGFMPSMSFAAAHRLLPFGLLGFGINLVTGMIFFIGAPEQYVENVSFHWKMALLELSGGTFLILTVMDAMWALPSGANPPRLARLFAASALLLAIGVMYFGRMLPFIGDAF